ncbi:MAG TPA: 4-hydroxybutyrate--acetyl-CoA CoA transferase [Candidatus Scatomorpha stercorigallinarum]|nr:4-hydroxybutyrate--acetyl-CoA CoA transferase [Candidatus Scatomorpha stercorigallinarum]
MDYREQLKQKLVTEEEALLRIPDNAYLFTYGYGEPVGILSRLTELKGKRKGITFVDSLNAKPYPFYSDSEMRGVVDSESIFFAHFCREFQKTGAISFIPNHLGKGFKDKLWAIRRRSPERPIVYAIQVSPMDEHGYFTTGTVGMSNRMMVENADIVILEIDENMPRTFGNTYIHVSEASCVYQGPNEMFYMPERPQSELDLKIGQFVADLIEDESTLQLGIGGIPNAVAVALRDKHNLGVHTEMLSDSLIDLYRAGVVTNAAKTLHKDKMVTAFSFGSRAAYEFLDNNPNVLHLEVGYTNDPAVIRQNRKMVSVNTTLQVDLTGQCASESIGTLQLSGTGGQTETASGARQSEGGKSIIALHSTANVKNADGERERVSTIVPTQPAGMAISLMRADVDFVVTEYGVASLRGASVRDRAMELISIAHPDYRDQLMYDAKRLYLM